jgi:hypothetical protein
MVLHLKKEHQWSRPRGHQSGTCQGASGLHTVAAFPVACQTFFRRNLYIRYLSVKLELATTSTDGQPEEPQSRLPTLSISEQITLQLSTKLALPDPAAPGCPGQHHFSQVSAWLETTQWTTYLRGHNLRQAAALIELPPSPAAIPQATLSEHESRSTEQLRLLLDSFDRLIEQARKSLLEDRVDVFDQHQVNSFLTRRSFKRTLWHKLKEPTYYRYKQVWKQLLCFLYRLVWQKQAPVLHCRLTSTQTATLEATPEIRVF